MSPQAKEEFPKALHGDGDNSPRLRLDLQNSRLLSVKAIDDCAKKLPRHVNRFAACR
jgi:hypothetical protein